MLGDLAFDFEFEFSSIYIYNMNVEQSLEVWVELFLTPKIYIYFIISFDRFSLLVMLPVVMILFFLIHLLLSTSSGWYLYVCTFVKREFRGLIVLLLMLLEWKIVGIERRMSALFIDRHYCRTQNAMLGQFFKTYIYFLIFKMVHFCSCFWITSISI